MYIIIIIAGVNIISYVIHLLLLVPRWLEKKADWSFGKTVINMISWAI